jgi:hypothetical protein
LNGVFGFLIGVAELCPVLLLAYAFLTELAVLVPFLEVNP